MKYTQKQITSGAWVDKSKLSNGQRAKIVSEVKPIESNFKDKEGNVQTQDVCKVHFEGQKESVNTSLNRATIGGLIDKFGDDSVNWQGHYLTVEMENIRVAGKASTALYLIPEGYEKTNDDNGYAVVTKVSVPTHQRATDPLPEVEYPEEDINPEDIPF